MIHTVHSDRHFTFRSSANKLKFRSDPLRKTIFFCCDEKKFWSGRIMSYYPYMVSVYRSCLPELNRSLRSSSVQRSLPSESTRSLFLISTIVQKKLNRLVIKKKLFSFVKQSGFFGSVSIMKGKLISGFSEQQPLARPLQVICIKFCIFTAVKKNKLN